MEHKRNVVLTHFGIVLILVHLTSSQLIDTDFAPSVSATCKAGFMTIRVALNQSFSGAIHARDFRTPACMANGNGTRNVVMHINLLATPGSPDYCGVLLINKTEERSIPIAVRIHKTLELADDKFYVITCGKAGFKNARNETSLVSLKVLEDGKKVQEAIMSHPYTLRAEMSRPDGTYGIRVKSCFAFNKFNSSVPLIDERGCPVSADIISQFKYDEKTGHADAQLFSMFRFPDSSEVHFQCDIGICKGTCIDTQCDSEIQPLAQSRSLANDIYTSQDEGVLMASTSVYVLEPGDTPRIQQLCDDSAVHPSWLLWLCIALGVLFLIMLIINIFLCSAMTCACARTEVIEKEPSIIDDYDPYRSWHGSQYGSRFSLNAAPHPKQGYTSGGSTMNTTQEDVDDQHGIQQLCDDSAVHPSWLLWLCIALGVLFLIMLIINIFLCSAMTCACARTEVIEKEPSIIDDYDPYRSWHGSQYGSRFSLNAAPHPKQGYTSGGSTMNSTRSISSHSDHYAIVHSRPGSRYSGPPKHHRGPPSNIGSHYSGK